MATTGTGPSDVERAIDAFINDAGGAWQKVALMIARALTDAPLNLADVEDAADRVAQRIAWLVRSGRLEAAGDVADWRHGEVRLAAHSPHAR
ncbi:hypothetical protein PK69_08325 [Xanthomonas phaseoli pv. phaseoli]|uniref:DUF2285 domain-containing protein n=2 Tax=Xanthomonas campestris pv. phaseoli TaxID=317013 RepID=A0AB34QKX9_XANCH|nr:MULTISPECIES: hypothetical protein [Xanthomonas]ATS21116.1 hypothetical protein XppCFBP412P_06260 [Xanthomonas phaseoli pv. phaseoli]ATS27790.1 hypothetical protein XppCFBP6164P_21695 [Xanthomonas phaseoli pv. phaseoli]ATS31607.1 hypothetical protein XppCFBP6546P_19630 [Xanthomonas phaseoli pv. phaseoli]ATS36026.1 hypothetical protein XppCFBP6982P_21040 [Xanthomonas phaseoli pv. phaseoli]AZU12954.1 hypothetical protein AC609_09590 [Xanthomonas phaseoli pv. phaseoli]